MEILSDILVIDNHTEICRNNIQFYLVQAADNYVVTDQQIT